MEILNAALADMVIGDDDPVPTDEQTEKLIQSLEKKYKLLPNEVEALRQAAEDAIGGPFEKYPAPARSGKNVLARNASSEVHKRNADFFDKNL